METIDLKIDNMDRVPIPTKIEATFNVEHPMLRTTNDHPKSVNIGKISTTLHAYYLNLHVLAQNRGSKKTKLTLFQHKEDTKNFLPFRCFLNVFLFSMRSFVYNLRYFSYALLLSHVCI